MPHSSVIICVKRLRYITITALLAGALWMGLPRSLYSVYRGYKEGRASGALVFSIVQAVGEQTTRGLDTNN
jgi:hypothetical protein